MFLVVMPIRILLSITSGWPRRPVTLGQIGEAVQVSPVLKFYDLLVYVAMVSGRCLQKWPNMGHHGRACRRGRHRQLYDRAHQEKNDHGHNLRLTQ